MKVVISKNIDKKWLSRRKRDKAKLVRYWQNLYPKDYAKDLVAQNSTDMKIL